MLTKNQLKFIQSLRIKKERESHQLFMVEGEKGLDELLLSPFLVNHIYATEQWLSPQRATMLSRKGIAHTQIGENDLARISQLTTPNQVVALVKIPERKLTTTYTGKYIALDQINDPGNLGTIIRIADWFGFTGIFCSPSSVDCYNAKVVQATMGSLYRIPIIYTELSAVIEQFKATDSPVYAAMLHGVAMHEVKKTANLLLLMGSESHGLSSSLAKEASHPITIPKYGGAESLNVAVATGILCAALV